MVGLDIFVASIGGVKAQTVDLLRFNDQDQSNEFSAHVRPLRAVQALVDTRREARADYQSGATRDV